GEGQWVYQHAEIAAAHVRQGTGGAQRALPLASVRTARTQGADAGPDRERPVEARIRRIGEEPDSGRPRRAAGLRRGSGRDTDPVGRVGEEKGETMIALLNQPWTERLGWTLLHFLWQGVLGAALYALA